MLPTRSIGGKKARHIKLSWVVSQGFPRDYQSILRYFCFPWLSPRYWRLSLYCWRYHMLSTQGPEDLTGADLNASFPRINYSIPCKLWKGGSNQQSHPTMKSTYGPQWPAWHGNPKGTRILVVTNSSMTGLKDHSTKGNYVWYWKSS